MTQLLICLESLHRKKEIEIKTIFNTFMVSYSCFCNIEK